MKKCTAVIIAAFVSALTFAQSPSLIEYVESVKKNNPDYKNAVLQSQKADITAQANRKEKVLSGSIGAQGGIQGTSSANSGLTPLAGTSVTAEIQAPAGAKIQAGADYSLSLSDALKSDSIGISATASIPVFVNGKFIDASLTEAADFVAIEAPYVSAKTAAEKQRLAVLDAVIRLALDTESMERKLVLAQKRLELAEKEAQIARIQWESGNTGFSVFDKTQKLCDEAKISVQEIHNGLTVYKAKLAFASGRESADVSGLTVPPPLDSETVRRISGISAEVYQAELQVKIAGMNIIVTGAQYAPVLSLSGRAGFPDTFAKTEGLTQSPTWSAALSISIPFPTGVEKLRKEAARLSYEASVEEEISAKQNDAQQIQSMYAEYEMACDRENLRAQMLSQAQTRLKEAERAYETETATALDKERAMLSVLEAESSLKDESITRFKSSLLLYTYFGMDPSELLSIK